MRAPKPLTMWAAVSPGCRRPWINTWTIRRTRRDAREAYFDLWNDEAAAKKYIKQNGIKFVRVTVAVQEEQ